MLINPGCKLIKRGTKKSIADIVCAGDYTIHVFQGSLSPNDILLKYSAPNVRSVRTPKHVHWAVDLLLKKEHSRSLTDSFLREIDSMWSSCVPLTGNALKDIEAYVGSYYKTFDYKKFLPLDAFGEYPCDFLFVLLSLLAVQEKTNATANGTTAVMFGKVVSELMKSDLDIFKIMSTAGFGGR